MQKNIRLDNGAWRVEIRFEGENRWIEIGVFASHTDAMRLYRKT